MSYPGSDHSAAMTSVASPTLSVSPVYPTWPRSYSYEESLSPTTESFPAFDDSCELAGALEICPRAGQETIAGVHRYSKINEGIVYNRPLSSILPYWYGTGERANVPAVSSSTRPLPPERERDADTVVYCMQSSPGVCKMDNPKTPAYPPWNSTETVYNTPQAKRQGCLTALGNALNTPNVTNNVKQRVELYTYSLIRMEEILQTQQNDTDSCCCSLHSDIPGLAEPIVTYLDQLDKRIRQKLFAARTANAYIRDICLDGTILPFQRFPKIVRYVFREAPKHQTEDLTILKRLQDLYEVLISNTFFTTWEHRHASADAASSPACMEIYNTLAYIESTLQDTIDRYAEFIGINQSTQDQYITPLSRQVLGASITWELERCRYGMEVMEAMYRPIGVN